MYGGKGVTPASSSRSKIGCDAALVTSQRPSPNGLSQTSGQASPNASLASVSPARGRPRSSTSQVAAGPAAPAGRRNSTSIRPPVARRKKARAGNTRVSLRTSTSPLRSRCGRSRNSRSSSLPSTLWWTSSRDASRLLVHHRVDGSDEDREFPDLPHLLRSGDVLVRNDTRVFPARAFFRRATGGRIEVLFLRPAGAAGPAATWEVLLRGRPRASEALGDAWPLVCERPFGDGRWLVTSAASQPVFDLLDEAGVTPLPPYIHEHLDDPERYQTTYARVSGSAVGAA